MKKARKIDHDKSLREHTLKLLEGRGAHIDFESLIADFPLEIINKKAPQIPYTPWHVLEHMRIALWDILEFSTNASHVSPPWPRGLLAAEKIQGKQRRLAQKCRSIPKLSQKN